MVNWSRHLLKESRRSSWCFRRRLNLACHVRYTIFCDDAILFYSNDHLGDDHHGHFWSKHVTKAFLFLKLVDFWLNCFPQFSFSFSFSELKLVCVSYFKGTIVYFRPMLFRFESLLNNDNHTNLDHAFTVANEEFSVPKLLEPGGKESLLCLRPCHFGHFVIHLPAYVFNGLQKAN